MSNYELLKSEIVNKLLILESALSLLMRLIIRSPFSKYFIAFKHLQDTILKRLKVSFLQKNGLRDNQQSVNKQKKTFRMPFLNFPILLHIH